MILVDLVYNLALLVALSVVSGFVDARWKRDTRLGRGASGGGVRRRRGHRHVAAVCLRTGADLRRPERDDQSGGFVLRALDSRGCMSDDDPVAPDPGRPPAQTMGVLVILASAVIGVGFHLRRRGKQEEVPGADTPGVWGGGASGDADHDVRTAVEHDSSRAGAHWLAGDGGVYAGDHS